MPHANLDYRIYLYSLSGCQDHEQNLSNDKVLCYTHTSNSTYDYVLLDGVQPSQFDMLANEKTTLHSEFMSPFVGWDIDRSAIYVLKFSDK